jgi:hypothetical protein
MSRCRLEGSVEIATRRRGPSAPFSHSMTPRHLDGPLTRSLARVLFFSNVSVSDGQCFIIPVTHILFMYRHSFGAPHLE